VSEQPGRYQRSFGGLIGAMVVLLLVVGAFVVFQDVTSREPANPVQAVAYQRTAQYARRQASFRLLAPPRLPQGWRATSVGFTPPPKEHWHLGVLTNQNRYVGLEQGTITPAAMLKKYVDKHTAERGPVSVAGRTWHTWTDSGGDVALVHRAAGATTLVEGHDVPVPQLKAYISSLR
jgi:hypothetical protein